MTATSKVAFEMNRIVVDSKWRMRVFALTEQPTVFQLEEYETAVEKAKGALVVLDTLKTAAEKHQLGVLKKQRSILAKSTKISNPCLASVSYAIKLFEKYN